MRAFNPEAMRDARLAKGMTQEQVAKLAKIARTNYVNHERGETQPGLAVLPRLAKALDLKPRDLVDVEDEEVTLRDLREWAGLSQTDAAKALGYDSPTSYQRIETGKSAAGAKLVRRLARLYGASVDELNAALQREPLPE